MWPTGTRTTAASMNKCLPVGALLDSGRAKSVHGSVSSTSSLSSSGSSSSTGSSGNSRRSSWGPSLRKDRMAGGEADVPPSPEPLILEDMSLFYYRQLASSLKVGSLPVCAPRQNCLAYSHIIIPMVYIVCMRRGCLVTVVANIRSRVDAGFLFVLFCCCSVVSSCCSVLFFLFFFFSFFFFLFFSPHAFRGFEVERRCGELWFLPSEPEVVTTKLADMSSSIHRTCSKKVNKNCYAMFRISLH